MDKKGERIINTKRQYLPLKNKEAIIVFMDGEEKLLSLSQRTFWEQNKVPIVDA